MPHKRTFTLFSYDWDRPAFDALAAEWPQVRAGFDLFSFPSNARLVWFDIDRFVALLAWRARVQQLSAVVSNHEQFGALVAAMLAERMGWPGTPVRAVLACQHKLYAREVLQRVCPEANLAFSRLQAAYGGPVPDDLTYPQFVKPVKAAFSVLARCVHSTEDLHAHTRFGGWELWVIRHLVEPFERVIQARLPEAGTAHSLMLEEPVDAPQYCLDGYVFNGEVVVVGVVGVRTYPGTQSFMGFDYPCHVAQALRQQATAVAQAFLTEIGFSHGGFNMEFFVVPGSQQVKVIEFNPRMASQFSDLYRRVDGVDLHAIALALAHGQDPASLPRLAPTAAVATSFVYRLFDAGRRPHRPSAEQKASFHQAYPDAVLLEFPMSAREIQRDFKWLGSHRYGIVHLGGQSPADLRRRCELASALLGWAAPLTATCLFPPGQPAGTARATTHDVFEMETTL